MSLLWVRSSKVLHGLASVNVRTSDDAEPANVRRQWRRACNTSSGSLSGVRDLLGRLVDDAVIVSAKPDSYFYSCHSVLFIKKPQSGWTESLKVSC